MRTQHCAVNYHKDMDPENGSPAPTLPFLDLSKTPYTLAPINQTAENIEVNPLASLSEWVVSSFPSSQDLEVPPRFQGLYDKHTANFATDVDATLKNFATGLKTMQSQRIAALLRDVQAAITQEDGASTMFPTEPSQGDGPCVYVNYHKDMDTGNGSPAPRLTDDLVVEVLSRLPYKSFCRFKCVCKDWLAFSSDPHYCKKLLKIPTGLLYQRRDNPAIKLASLPHNDKEFDEALSFLPQYEQLELMDSCNGLVLFKYKSNDTPLGICRFIVCNPATREWRMLPDTPRSHYNPFYNMSVLAFSPSWSAKFYVFNFQRLSTRYLGFGPVKLQVFSSDLSTWFVDDTSWLSGIIVSQPHLFIDGALYVKSDMLNKILVLKSLEGTSTGIPPSLRIIELPQEDVEVLARFDHGCFGQSRGALHYSLPDKDAHAILVWSLDVDEPYEWTLKYRLSMSHAFGRDNFIQDDARPWKLDYRVIALDLKRDRLLLLDNAADKLCLYKISTGELTEIQPGDHRGLKWSDKYCHYVASYSMLPALTM